MFGNDTEIDMKKVQHNQIYSYLVQEKCDVSKTNIKYSEHLNINYYQLETIYGWPYNVKVSNRAKAF